MKLVLDVEDSAQTVGKGGVGQGRRIGRSEVDIPDPFPSPASERDKPLLFVHTKPSVLTLQVPRKVVDVLDDDTRMPRRLDHGPVPPSLAHFLMPLI